MNTQRAYMPSLTVRMWYGTVPNAELAKRIGKPVEFVESEAVRLGLVPGFPSRKPPVRAKNPVAVPKEKSGHSHLYTKADDDMIREYYPDMDTDKLAKLMGRNARALCVRAHKIGVSKSAQYLTMLAVQRQVVRSTTLVEKLRAAGLLISNNRHAEALDLLQEMVSKLERSR